MQTKKPALKTFSDAAREALAALTAADLARADRLIARLEAAAPEHPTARELRKWLSVMKFSWPAQRQTYVPDPRKAADTASVDLVAFHIGLSATPTSIHDEVDYVQTLRLALDSAALRAPGARRIVLTDDRTRFPDDLPAEEIRRLPIDPARAMYERMRAQVAYLDTRPEGRSSILMDTDILVNRDPGLIFAEDFDVALTWRDNHVDAPFNGGLIAIGPGKAGLQFLSSALACYDRIADDATVAPLFPKNLRAWWGDQFALAALVGHAHFLAGNKVGACIDGVRVRFLPCEQYNAVLDPGKTYGIDALKGIHFLHFKGKRKRLMDDFLVHIRNGTI